MKTTTSVDEIRAALKANRTVKVTLRDRVHNGFLVIKTRLRYGRLEVRTSYGKWQGIGVNYIVVIAD